LAMGNPDADDIAALTRVIEKLKVELQLATFGERRQWLRYSLEAIIDVRAHMARQAGITVPQEKL
jgi:hypothetical protein